MRALIRKSAVTAALAVGAFAPTAGIAQADGVDNHHDFRPTIDCRKNTYGALAIFSPTVYYNSTDRSTTVCYANDNAGHPSVTHLFGLLNLGQ
ncbi:hypothetical protein AB0F13_01110 [Streptomyces sp. NPDC026206]|uniref:hypothetical protein n=1 Tax=Streptomyces sp. NPDC026206 TaxID=3157089 RepID=UPI0034053F69